jgi:hypothetical protein
MKKAIGATSNWVMFVLLVVLLPLLIMAGFGYFWTAWFSTAIPLRSAATTQPIEVGPQFEVLGAMFTLGGYVALVGTLWYQRQQIVDERKRAADDQVRSEFFQLLSTWQEIVHNTRYGEDEGRAAFVELSKKLGKVDKMIIGSEVEGKIVSDKGTEKILYSGFYRDEVQASLGNYFRLFYHIIRYVNESHLCQKDKDDLARIARAHLSEPELHLLFWNALGEHGVEKMKPLVEKYDLLQNYGGFSDQQFKELYDFRAAKRDKKGECVTLSV